MHLRTARRTRAGSHRLVPVAGPALATTTLITLLAGGCAAPGTTASGVPTGAGAATVRLAETGDYDTLNPLEYPLGITSKLYDGLVAVGADGVLEPGLAAAMPVPDADLTSWTVTLREGVTFSDGSVFDAHDVVAAFDAVRDPDMGSWMAADYAMIDAVTAVDATTVRFDLAHPYAGLPARLTLGIPASEALGDSVVDSPLATTPVGTGPYVLAEWRRGDSMTLQAREDWWGGTPEVQTIHLAFVADENARAQRVRSGEVDGAQLSPRTAAQLDGVDGLELVTNPSADYRAISLPVTLPFFADPAVRVALNLATDRQAMIDGILAGHGVAVAGPFTPAQGDAYDPSATFEHDPEAAAALLDKAGWTIGADGVRAKDGVPFAFTVMYFAEDTLRRDVAQAFASDLAPLGIEVSLEGVDRPYAVTAMDEKAFVLGGGDMPYDPDAQAYRQLHSDFAVFDEDDAYSNPSGYADPRVDRLLEAARAEADPAARAALYRQVQRRLVDNPPMVAVFALEHTYVARGLDAWDGLDHVLEPHSHGVAWGPWFNVHEWRRP
ncbi:ABC transporter substrate-binding protein [Isoptericola variabilis]|uniref:ABC-type transporter, periplasmic subunit n=1 Tax=Isoptericola variabilis (strain 225) TaxID=743718 RepID=F6FR40_ISOV2|nr:ABC transporter substrate-binding protein [Isoptericola variabilis]AEG44990.1 ABC-type transporter, periplasmic subunit [Isoptericola variabilis 225]TWH25998.1 peptide/nickel transport system substrate-binding protein [Isoptericola variabilis J7]